MFTHPKQVLECKKYFYQNNKLISKRHLCINTLYYTKIKSFINNNVDDIKSISCTLIPNYPVGTFRDNVGLENSLFDFGCYHRFFCFVKKLYDFRILNIRIKWKNNIY